MDHEEKTGIIDGTITIVMNSGTCPDEGNDLFNFIDNLLVFDSMVRLEFKDDALITSTFLSASIGQLYGKYSPVFLAEHLTVVLPLQDHQLLYEVIENVK